MTRSSGDRLVVISAVTVAGVFAYTKWKGHQTTSVGTFATAWGVVYFTLALVSSGAPQVAGAFALLVLVADLLANMPQLTAAISAAGINVGPTSQPGTQASVVKAQTNVTPVTPAATVNVASQAFGSALTA